MTAGIRRASGIADATIGRMAIRPYNRVWSIRRRDVSRQTPGVRARGARRISAGL